VSSAYERQEDWRRKNQETREEVAWRFHSDPAHQEERRESEQRARAEAAHAEQARLRAEDFIYRFRPDTESDPLGWLPPHLRSRFSTGAAPAAETREPLLEELLPQLHGATPPAIAPEAPAAIPLSPPDTEIQPEGARADYAIIPVGDEAAIEALADGLLEVFEHPKTGLTAKLTSDSGQRFIYAGMWRAVSGESPRRVRAGETIGFTSPKRAAHGAWLPQRPAMEEKEAAPKGLPEPKVQPFGGRTWPRSPMYAAAAKQRPEQASAAAAAAARTTASTRRGREAMEVEASSPAPGRTGALVAFGLVVAIALNGGKRRRGR
jgi:hypothetical protein